jgi:signal transduction histidine kinase
MSATTASTPGTIFASRPTSPADLNPAAMPPAAAPASINVVAEEITERKGAEAALAVSQERFHELADDMSQLAWTADATGWRTWFNKHWYDYTFVEMQGWGWQKAHHPDHVDRVVNRIRESCKNGTPWEDTFPLRAADGSYRWFLTRAAPICGEAGDVARWFGTRGRSTPKGPYANSTKHWRSASRRRPASATGSWSVSQDLLAAAGGDGTIVSVNPAWTETLGWSEDELLGKSLEWVVHPDDLEKSKNEIYAIGRDVTELRYAEEQLRTLHRELALVARQTTMGTMTASIAHEVKQPLAAIVTNANAGLRWLNRPDPNFDEVRAVLQRIVTAGHRANEVIAGIRAMFEKNPCEKAPVNVNALIGEVLALMEAELESHDVALHTAMLDGLPDVIAERVQLQQVLLNLIVNGVEAMSSVTGRERRLTVKSEIHDIRAVRIAVEDSGAGLDPSHMDRIFDPFFTTKPQGMGMGLSICRSIIDSHGGRLWATPHGPHGTTFYVELPVRTQDGATVTRCTGVSSE